LGITRKTGSRPETRQAKVESGRTRRYRSGSPKAMGRDKEKQSSLT
jgi:hypothetical protein